jgi:DNA-binding IscR family transcriptional regulator
MGHCYANDAPFDVKLLHDVKELVLARLRHRPRELSHEQVLRWLDEQVSKEDRSAFHQNDALCNLIRVWWTAMEGLARGERHVHTKEMQGRSQNTAQRAQDPSVRTEPLREALTDSDRTNAEACNVKEETNDSSADTEQNEKELTDRQRSILETMLEHEIASHLRRKTRAGIVRLINRTHNAETYGRDFAALVRDRYLETQEGPRGGCWLTPSGKARAASLRLAN